MALQKLTAHNFDAAVAEGPVLIDFFANWCGPCKMLAPAVHALAEDQPALKVFQVDVDEAPELAARFRVMSIPTLVLMKDGKPVKTSVGLVSRARLDELAAEVL